MLETIGGVPIHVRTKQSGSNIKLSYYAKMPTRPEIETFNSNFLSLGVTDSITITSNDIEGGFSTSMIVTFASSGLTRDQIVTRINSLWATASNTSSGPGAGAAHIQGTISAPYNFGGGSNSTLKIAVDGGTFTSVSLTTSNITAYSVAVAINNAITGLTATAITNVSGEFVELRSNNQDGTTSSISIESTNNSDVFRVLGLIPGIYKGYSICQPSGASEIKFIGIGRGSSSSITIYSANSNTIANMGLPVGTYYGKNEGEESVDFPSLSTSGTSQKIALLFPEVMDFGEVPVSTSSTLASFSNKSSGSQFSFASKSYSIDGSYATGIGINAIGHPIVLDQSGLLPSSAANQFRTEYDNFFKKFIDGDFSARTINALVTNNIEGSGYNDNTLSTSAKFTIDVDPVNAHSGVARSFDVQFSKGGTPFTPFKVSYLPTAVNTVNWFIDANDVGSQHTAFANTSGPIRFYDSNTETYGGITSGSKVIPFSGNTGTQGDGTLRIMESEYGNTEPISILRQMNSKWCITVGNGTTSFGDFNGFDAIQQAIAFFLAHVPSNVTTLKIQLKSGPYFTTSANQIVVPATINLILEGISDSEVNITSNDNTDIDGI
ncbi:MAG TPA: hypothetical protein ENI76_02035, partial [Ignavibacteria bacterium]|nr:hypothetical protein [Ignavibacteria bacterium]